MRFKVILAILCLALISNSAIANSSKYTLTYQQQNKWVAKEDLQPMKDAVAFFQNNDLKITATCKNTDKNCKQRVDIINHIFAKQKVKQQISNTLISSTQKENTISLESIELDFNKYSNLFINYTNKSILPIKQSQSDFNKHLKKSELKYLSKFKMYCKVVDQTCKNRFNHLNNIIGKTLTFKYNFALYENPNLNNNVAQIVNHRHSYNINNPIAKPKTTAAIEKKKEKKKTPVNSYTNKKHIIVFNNNESVLLNSEKVKIENLIINSKNNKFNFTCNLSNNDICQKRIHEIKNYALRNINNIIEMYQIEKTTQSNYIIIQHK